VLDHQPERLKTLHTLTGGNPRVLALIYRLLESDESGAAMADLEILLDQVTPYYKARIEEYQSAQQRAVIDAIALNWDPITTGNLASATNIVVTTLSSVLNKLRKDGFIESLETSGSYAGHQLVERFLNIWYLMRHGTRRTKQKMRWLVAFLTSFYSSTELAEIAARAKSAGVTKKWHADYAFAFQEAMARHSARRSGGDQRRYSLTAGSLLDLETAASAEGKDRSDGQLSAAHRLMRRAEKLWTEGDFAGCALALEELVTRFGDSETLALRTMTAMALNNMAAAYGRLGEESAANTTYDRIVEQYAEDPEPGMRRWAATALFRKAVRLGRMNESDAAIAAYDELVRRFGDSGDPGLQSEIAGALFNKAITLGELGDYNGEIAVYDEIVARYAEAEESELREHAAKALFNKSVTFSDTGQTAEELSAYRELVDRFGDDDHPGTLAQVAAALVNQAITVGESGDKAGEIAIYQDVVDRFGKLDEVPALRAELVRAQVNKAATLGELGHTDDEGAEYDAILARFGDSEEPMIQEEVARALVNKAVASAHQGSLEEALVGWGEVVDRFGHSERPILCEQVALALTNKAIAFGERGDSEASIQAHSDVISRFGNRTEPEVLTHVIGAWFGKGVALGAAGDTVGAIAAYEALLALAGDDPRFREDVAKAMVNRASRLERIGERTRSIEACEEIVARFRDAEEPGLREAVARALVIKGGALAGGGDAEAALSAYDEAITRLGDPDSSLSQEQFAVALRGRADALATLGRSDPAIAAFEEVLHFLETRREPSELFAMLGAESRIRLANLLLDTRGEKERSEALYLQAAGTSPLWARVNLAWLYLLDGRVLDAEAARTELDELPLYGRLLLDSALEISKDNFGTGSELLAAALGGDLDQGTMDFSDDLERLLRLAERKGHGDRLLAWLEESGYSDRVAPVYAAFKAFVRGEKALLDVNPEVRQPARIIYDRLDAPRRHRSHEESRVPSGRRRGSRKEG
jgi:tetratricopeptide (TPR) repeat protein